MFSAVNTLKIKKPKKFDVKNLPTTKASELRKQINLFICKMLAKKKEDNNWVVSLPYNQSDNLIIEKQLTPFELYGDLNL
jgi:hypothetical protein